VEQIPPRAPGPSDQKPEAERPVVAATRRAGPGLQAVEPPPAAPGRKRPPGYPVSFALRFHTRIGYRPPSRKSGLRPEGSAASPA